MKQTFAILLFFGFITIARADFVITEAMQSAEVNGNLTMQIKGDKIRVDMDTSPIGKVSAIMDLKTGDTVSLMPAQKIAMKIPGAQIKQMLESAKKPNKALTDDSPKLIDTGKKDIVGNYQTEIYSYDDTNGMIETLWVAKDFPDYKEINAEFAQLNNSAFADLTKAWNSEDESLPGMVVKSEVNTGGQKITVTLLSATNENLDASVFETPKDYQVMDMNQPAVTQGAQQTEDAADATLAALKIGTQFPDFSEKDVTGQPLSIANYKGKVVMIDFWATWCGPCRGEIPNVVATYQKYHDKGFEIIGVSLDQDRQKLLDFTKENGMTWQQFFDGQGWNNKLAVKYGIESIPMTFLLDGNGKIIGKDLRGQELTDAVAGAVAGK